MIFPLTNHMFSQCMKYSRHPFVPPLSPPVLLRSQVSSHYPSQNLSDFDQTHCSHPDLTFH